MNNSTCRQSMGRKSGFERLESRLCMAVLSDLTVIAQTGAGPHLLTSIGRGVSINDNGYIAFQGESANSNGDLADNIYAYTGASISQLMKPVFMYPNAGVDSSAPGTASIIEEVQINNSNEVLARRRLNARVQIGFPFGSIETAPLTYLETWQATAGGAPSLPVSQVAMGLPAAASAHLWFFLSPVTGGFLPSPLDLGSPYEGLFRTATINNLGQVNFSAIVRGSGNGRASANTNGDQVGFGGIGTLSIDPMLADNGWYVFKTSDGRIFAEPWALNAPLQTLASAAGGFVAVSEAGISDDGRFIIFAGAHTLTGRGLYVSAFNAAANAYDPAVKVLGISGDGMLDPGETHNDVDGDGAVDPGEDVGGLDDVDLSSRVNINRYRNNYVAAFLGADDSGKPGVFSTMIDASLPTPRAFAPAMLAGVGDTVPALSGTLTGFQLHDSVNNRGTIAIWASTSTGDEAILRSFAPPPTAVVVVTHGLGNTWDPPFLAPFDPFGSTFLDTWRGIGQKFEDLPLPTSPLFEQVESYVADWSSSDGWFEAALSYVASLVLFEYPLLSRLADFSYKAHLIKSALNAERAARTIVSDLTTSGLLASPELTHDGTQVIQLVGHSRGGAVNARVAELLTRRGYFVEEYIALDGYSVDWTFPSDAFADIDINETIGIPVVRDNINNAVNFRVEDGLADLTFDALRPAFDLLGAAILGPLASSIITPTVLDLVRSALPDFQAPVRDNFDSNPVVIGSPTASNHLNIGPIYLASDTAADPSRRYILQSYVGQNSGRVVPATSALSAASVRFDDMGENDVLETLQLPYGFADRNFEATRELLAAAEAPEVIGHEEPLVRLWGQLVGNPNYALSTHWDVTGDATAVIVDGDARAELTETSNTSLGQLVRFRPGDRRLEFDVYVIAPGSSDAIVVQLDGREIGVVELAGAVGRQSIALPTVLPDIGQLTLSLRNNGGATAVVQVDDLALAGDPGDYDRNGVVDGNDFLIWQRQVGAEGDQESDGTGNGVVDAGDLGVWREHVDDMATASAVHLPAEQHAATEIRDAVFAAGDFTALFSPTDATPLRTRGYRPPRRG